MPFHIHHILSRYLGLDRRITVWLPPGWRAARRRYPILLLNDGQNLFDPRRAFAGQTWQVRETVAWLIRHKRMPPIIIAGIDHGGGRRGREYLPIEDDRNPGAKDPLGSEYAEFVTGEVLPFMLREYPIATGASNTGFGGSSYGAIAALNTAMVKPGVFGRLLIESPSLYVGGEYVLRRARAARRWPSRVYLGVGTTETSRADRNEETVENVRKLESILRRTGLGPRRLRVVVEEGGAHSESAWARRLPTALEFLYGGQTG